MRYLISTTQGVVRSQKDTGQITIIIIPTAKLVVSLKALLEAWKLAKGYTA
jgi:hypothetical protein